MILPNYKNNESSNILHYSYGRGAEFHDCQVIFSFLKLDPGIDIIQNFLKRCIRY